MNNLEEVEEDLLKLKHFNLKFKGDLKFNSYEEVILYASTKIIHPYNNISRLPKTYYENNQLQCECTIGRGISDLWRICKYYFPNVKLQQIIDYIDQNNSIFFIQYCNTTLQTVIRCGIGYKQIFYFIRGRHMKKFKYYAKQ
jgi:hypothetical protein